MTESAPVGRLDIDCRLLDAAGRITLPVPGLHVGDLLDVRDTCSGEGWWATVLEAGADWARLEVDICK